MDPLTGVRNTECPGSYTQPLRDLAQQLGRPLPKDQQTPLQHGGTLRLVERDLKRRGSKPNTLQNADMRPSVGACVEWSNEKYSRHCFFCDHVNTCSDAGTMLLPM
jgi:hypothetical protein